MNSSAYPLPAFVPSDTPYSSKESYNEHDQKFWWHNNNFAQQQDLAVQNNPSLPRDHYPPIKLEPFDEYCQQQQSTTTTNSLHYQPSMNHLERFPSDSMTYSSTTVTTPSWENYHSPQLVAYESTNTMFGESEDIKPSIPFGPRLRKSSGKRRRRLRKEILGQSRNKKRSKSKLDIFGWKSFTSCLSNTVGFDFCNILY